MSWLDDQIREDEERQTQETAIAREAPKIYQVLWDGLIQIVNEAKKKGFVLKPTGSNMERSIQLVYDNENPRRMNLVSRDKRTLTADISGGRTIKFSFAICEDGVVCLKNEGKPISIEDAAHAIMKPFLFPDLS
jgi:hypothetical protein